MRLLANALRSPLASRLDPAVNALGALGPVPRMGQIREGSRHGGRYKMDYIVMKERPLGPHKKLPPNVKHDGRVGPKDNYRYIVHYPEDGKYTTQKLPITKLGGRDIVTGRKIIGRVGGGSKQKYRWIDWRRLPQGWDPEGPDLVERVLKVAYDPVRKPMIALTGYENNLRWQIATEGMKAGDLIRTSCQIPNLPVKPVPGDSHPLGALPIGATVCLVQWHPDSDEVKLYKERDFATIIRHVGDRVVIQFDKSKFQYSLDPRCQCVVGSVSIHPLKALHIGCPNRLRWLGRRPRSGFWHRKTGRHGRKIKALPPVEIVEPEKPKTDIDLIIHCDTEGTRGRPQGKKRKFFVDKW